MLAPLLRSHQVLRLLQLVPPLVLLPLQVLWLPQFTVTTWQLVIRG